MIINSDFVFPKTLPFKTISADETKSIPISLFESSGANWFSFVILIHFANRDLENHTASDVYRGFFVYIKPEMKLSIADDNNIEK